MMRHENDFRARGGGTRDLIKNKLTVNCFKFDEKIRRQEWELKT